MDKNQTQILTRFLEKYAFIKVDSSRKEMKLDENAKEFLTQKATS